jgi:hypothetical protein
MVPNLSRDRPAASNYNALMRRAQRLQFGPYKQPRYRRGQKLDCERRGELTVVGTSAGRIPWPIGGKLGGRSLVLFKDLARAVKQESPTAVCYWWGVTWITVWKWRKVLKVPISNPGTHRLRSDHAKGKQGQMTRAAAALTVRDPARREKIRAKAIGRKHTAKMKAMLRRAKLGVKLSAAHRRKISEAARRLGTWPPNAGPPWSAEEDGLLRRLPPAEVAKRTGRTPGAVYARRRVLGLARRNRLKK